MKLFFQLFFFLFLSFHTIAQTTVTGSVSDADTGEKLPFVNVYFKGTTTGTATDIEGNFSLTSTEVSDTLIASFIGYESTKIYIKKDSVQHVNIVLGTGKIALQEVVIKAGENPAFKIMRKIVANKDSNNLSELTAYEYETYNKVEFDLNNIDAKFTDKRIFNKVQFLFENIDTSEYNGKAYLPVFITESISDYYYRKDINKEKEIIKATKISGVNNKSVSQFMGDMYQKLNVYDNYMVAFNKSLISPLNNNWKNHYKYYLIDSIVNYKGFKVYEIEFKPKHKQDLAFTGTMYINSNKYAVESIKMRIAEDANLNFVNDIIIEQSYINVGDYWMLQKDKTWIDFNLTDGSKGFFGTKTSSYKNIKINTPKTEEFFKGIEKIQVAEDAQDKKQEYWDEIRHEKLSDKEQFVYDMVDTVKNVPLFKTFADVVNTALTGYYVKGPLEYGPYFTTFSYNLVEGGRLRLGAQTSNKFSKRLRLRAYGAYGFKDERFKQGYELFYFLSKKPHRQSIDFKYKNDVEQLGQSSNAFRGDNLLSSVLRRNPAIKLANVEQIKAEYFYEFFHGLYYKLKVDYRNISPLGSLEFLKTNSLGVDEKIGNIYSTEFSTQVRFAHKEKYIEGVFDRVRIRGKRPVIQLGYTYGLKQLNGVSGNYHKLNVNIEQRVRVHKFGYFDYILDAGKIIGSLPYPLLELHPGNETFSHDKYSFNMMNYYEFASDRYFSATYRHHFNGYFFNRVPLFRKLKWREVATGKLLLGGLSDKHTQELKYPAILFKATQPYAEVGFGIENIFKVLRIDGVWRLTHLSHPNVAAFGLRGSFQIAF